MYNLFFLAFSCKKVLNSRSLVPIFSVVVPRLYIAFYLSSFICEIHIPLEFGFYIIGLFVKPKV